VNPGQRPGDPEPGLVEVGNLSGQQRLEDGIGRRADQAAIFLVMAASAASTSHLVLGDLGLHRRDLRHTCRRITPASRAAASPRPQSAQQDGSCRTTRPGCSLSCMVTPGCPSGRPGFRPLLARSDFGAGLASLSDDGGLEEFFFCRTRAARSATWA
jgi:hypothetical protein